MILPNAKAKFAKLIVKTVKNKSLNDLIYLFISKKIIKLVNKKNTRRVSNFVGKTILENKISKITKKVDTGNIG